MGPSIEGRGGYGLNLTLPNKRSKYSDVWDRTLVKIKIEKL